MEIAEGHKSSIFLARLTIYRVFVNMVRQIDMDVVSAVQYILSIIILYCSEGLFILGDHWSHHSNLTLTLRQGWIKREPQSIVCRSNICTAIFWENFNVGVSSQGFNMEANKHRNLILFPIWTPLFDICIYALHHTVDSFHKWACYGRLVTVGMGVPCPYCMFNNGAFLSALGSCELFQLQNATHYVLLGLGISETG